MSFFKRYFFVDYENVNLQGLNGIENLMETDSVSIFYSEYAQSLTFDYHKKINSSPADIDLVYIGSGEKNALDFQLSSFLGFLISESRHYFPDEDIKYYIITNDKGYLCLKDFWEKRGVSVELFSDIALSRDKTVDPFALIEERHSSTDDICGLVIPDKCLINANDMNFILNTLCGDISLTQDILLLSASGGTKSDLNVLLMRRLKDSKRASGVHSLLKHLFA